MESPTPGESKIVPEAAAATAAPSPQPRPPLQLRKGTRIRIGSKAGTVKEVRGGWMKPYEVRMLWDGDSCPEYLVFTALEHEYTHGRLLLE